MNEELAAAGQQFRVLHAIEMNLSPAGEGDMDPTALASLDLVLGAFHSNLRVTDDQTEGNPEELMAWVADVRSS